MAARYVSGLQTPKKGFFVCMFTGIIEQQGMIQKKTAGRLHVQAESTFVKKLSPGASVAVNGACLTVSDIPAKDIFAADVMPETLRRTTLGSLKQGSPVNLELPLKAEGRFGGHIVQGHVDGTAKVTHVGRSDNSHIVSFSAPEELTKYMVEKGSVAIDGISLTLIEVDDGGFSIGIIPHTKGHTTFARVVAGDMVNVEVDIVAKYVHKFTRSSCMRRHEK